MRRFHVLFGVALASCTCGGIAIAATPTKTVSLPAIVHLPTTRSVEGFGGGFRVRRATSADLKGQSTYDDVPAWLVDIHGAMGWDSGVQSGPPSILISRSDRFRNRVALFGSDPAGWLVVPKGWHIQYASEGAQPGYGLGFVAPGGARNGWMVSWSTSGIGSILASGEGLFPNAKRRYLAFVNRPVGAGLIAVTFVQDPVRLSPTPTSLTHPNRCTALVTYRSDGLVVKGIALWQPPMHPYSSDPYSTAMYIAMPANDTEMETYIVKMFERTRFDGQQVCPTTGW
jgi:hypothetical protein